MTRTGTVLDEIIAGVLEDLGPRRARRSAHDLEQLVAAVAPARDARGALSADESTMGLIAEVKRSSPSKGSLAPIPAPADLAAIYADPATNERLIAAGINPVSSTPEEFDAFFRKEAARWTKVFKESGIKLN